MAESVLPLQGKSRAVTRGPRALPSATMFEPFGLGTGFAGAEPGRGSLRREAEADSAAVPGGGVDLQGACERFDVLPNS